MDQKQHRQDMQYHFPYHHVCSFEDENFSLSQHLFWGYEYMAYIDFVVELLKKRNPSSLLDMGCGDGKLLHEAHRALPQARLEGVDYSPVAVTLARGFNPSLTVTLANVIEDNPFSKTFDVITLIEVLEHIPPEDTPAFLSANRDLLSPDGEMILTVPGDNIPVNKKHYQHFNESSLRKTLENYFEIKELYFLNTRSFLQTAIEKLLSNRLFILNQRGLRNSLFKLYRKKLLHSSRERCSRLCAVAIPKR